MSSFHVLGRRTSSKTLSRTLSHTLGHLWCVMAPLEVARGHVFDTLYYTTLYHMVSHYNILIYATWYCLIPYVEVMQRHRDSRGPAVLSFPSVRYYLLQKQNGDTCAGGPRHGKHAQSRSDKEEQQLCTAPLSRLFVVESETCKLSVRQMGNKLVHTRTQR
jgi:hypothetical protein